MKQLNLAVIGCGHRGNENIRTIVTLPDVTIAAVCDVSAEACEKTAEWVREHTGTEPFVTQNYEDILNKHEWDAVLVFTNWETHIGIAIKAMNAGHTTAIEVGGAYNLDECFELVETWERTRVPFMLLENCCYGRREMLISNIVKAGLFGEIVHCHGAYGHDLRKELTNKVYYRVFNYLNRNCENYPTHEIGPISQLLGINRGNRMVSLVSVASKSAGLKRYIEDNKDSIGNKDLIGKEFAQGDIVNTLITCANGETISLRLDTTLPRPYSREFTVRGTKGLYEDLPSTIMLDGEEKGFTYQSQFGNFEKYEEEYLPDCWKQMTEEMIRQGHGGMDYIMFDAYFTALRNGDAMPIDVYDAAAWMCISCLSEESIKKGNMSVEVPDFTKGEWKTRR